MPPEQAIAKANKAARMEPTRAGYINAIQVYPWTEGALYRPLRKPGEGLHYCVAAGRGTDRRIHRRYGVAG